MFIVTVGRRTYRFNTQQVHLTTRWFNFISTEVRIVLWNRSQNVFVRCEKNRLKFTEITMSINSSERHKRQKIVRPVENLKRALELNERERCSPPWTQIEAQSKQKKEISKVFSVADWARFLLKWTVIDHVKRLWNLRGYGGNTVLSI